MGATVKGVMVSGVMMSGAIVSCAMVSDALSGALDHWPESVPGNKDLGIGSWELGLVAKLICYRIGQW